MIPRPSGRLSEAERAYLLAKLHGRVPTTEIDRELLALKLTAPTLSDLLHELRARHPKATAMELAGMALCSREDISRKMPRRRRSTHGQ